MAVNDHDWAVVISVSDYEGATAKPPWITKLKGPDNDAAAIAADRAPFVHASLATGEDEDAVMSRLTTSLLAPRSALEDLRKVEPA
jgi:hypothetical protein